jgi:hypothetical protein
VIAAAWHLPASPLFVEGLVVDATGPVQGASVGWQGDSKRVMTDARGRFRLRSTGDRLIAHKPGYRIASTLAADPSLRLLRLPEIDNDDYDWIDPHPNPTQANNCANCHAEIYREWNSSAHAGSATNPKFLSLYAGTDGTAPPQPKWNARHEHPDGAAVCATCHAPTLTSPTLDYDVREANGVAKSGVHCDYCHKVVDAPTDKIGLRFGRDALELLRPASSDLLSYGPLDDAVRKGESFATFPVYKESRYCATCHEGTILGVHAYGTYSEWLESPARAQGKQCQNCHMTPTGKMTNVALNKGGIERRPETLASHHTPGASLDMLLQALDLKVTLHGRRVETELTARNVGHRVPTGFPDRQLILVVTATDSAGRAVAMTDGPRLPPSTGRWPGHAGTLYAKQLIGEKNRTPIPFWLHVENVEDTRLTPAQPDRRAFVVGDSARRVSVQLWYRRFWHEVADARGWTDNDRLIYERTLSVPAP